MTTAIRRNDVGAARATTVKGAITKCLATGAVLLSLGAAGCASAESARLSGTGGKGANAADMGTGSTMGSAGSGAVGSGGSGGNGGNRGTIGTSAPVSLPMVVTDSFNNQGWFGDANVSTHFTAGAAVIRQSDSSTGPCGTRLANSVGKCIEVIYTPPAGLPAAVTSDAYVGVFLLTTLAAAHPELTPPANVGEANWGVEPGKSVVAGATKISFRAAAAMEGLAVTFKAGTTRDTFAVPEQSEILSTSWKSYSLSLVGMTYSPSVIGPFAWILKDTSKAATFYIDGIVWE